MGGVQWAFKTGGPIVTSPAIADGVVYIASLSGFLYAIDQRSGQEKWKFKSRMPIASSPAVANGKVYFGAGDVYAVDAKSGILQWKFATQNVVHASPAVAGGAVFVGSWDGSLYAIDAATGRKKWNYPTSKSWVNGTPAVRDGLVYVGTSDSSRFMALDARTGRLRWYFDAKAYIFSSAALAWEFQTASSKQDRMKALNPDGSLNEEGFTPVFGDFQDMYVDFYRYISIGAIMSSPSGRSCHRRSSTRASCTSAARMGICTH